MSRWVLGGGEHMEQWTIRSGRARFGGFMRVIGLTAVARAVREVVGAPFRVDPDAAFTTSLAAREQLRRQALLRLIVLVVVVVEVAIPVPLTFFTHTPAFTLYLSILCNVLSLVFNRYGWTFVASLLFLISGPGLILMSPFSSATGLDEQSVFLLAIIPIYLILAGLILPRWAIWPAIVVYIGATIAVVLVMPAPQTQQLAVSSTGAPVPSLKTLTLRFLPSIELLTGILTWIFARSTRAGLETVTRAFEREREMVALKDRFLIDANHELRTPIMALYNNVEVISLLGTDGAEQQRAIAIKQALGAGDVVLHLLDSVLDASALEEQVPRLTLGAVALAPLVRSVLETFDPRQVGEIGLEAMSYPSRAVQVDVAEMLVARADEGRVRQVLVNLLANALKYSEPGTLVEIYGQVVDATLYAPVQPPRARREARRRSRSHAEAASGKRAASYARISVRDYGLGVPPRDVSKLFNRFVRLERDIAGSVRGTGLGLYMCRVLVEAMGGRIWVESSGVPGEGSTFSFTLPLDHTQSSQPASPLPSPIGSASAGDGV